MRELHAGLVRPSRLELELEHRPLPAAREQPHLRDGLHRALLAGPGHPHASVAVGRQGVAEGRALALRGPAGHARDVRLLAPCAPRTAPPGSDSPRAGARRRGRRSCPGRAAGGRRGTPRPPPDRAVRKRLSRVTMSSGLAGSAACDETPTGLSMAMTSASSKRIHASRKSGQTRAHQARQAPPAGAGTPTRGGSTLDNRGANVSSRRTHAQPRGHPRAPARGIPRRPHRRDRPHRDAGPLSGRRRAPQFGGKSRVDQHKMVYAALGELMDGAIHALALTTRVTDGG